MINPIYYVYVHRKRSDSSIFYVGKGKGGRFADTANRNQHWHNVVNKHGLDIDLLHCALSDSEAIRLEIETIEACKNFGIKLVNATNGGEGLSGFKHSEETKKKISVSQSGKIFTAEHRLKLSITSSGRFVSDETKKKHSINNHFRNPEFIKRNSESNKKKIICSNWMRFDSATDAQKWAVEQGLSKAKDGSQITACCTGKQPKTYGFMWAYYDGK